MEDPTLRYDDFGQPIPLPLTLGDRTIIRLQERLKAEEGPSGIFHLHGMPQSPNRRRDTALFVDSDDSSSLSSFHDPDDQRLDEPEEKEKVLSEAAKRRLNQQLDVHDMWRWVYLAPRREVAEETKVAYDFFVGFIKFATQRSFHHDVKVSVRRERMRALNEKKVKNAERVEMYERKHGAMLERRKMPANRALKRTGDKNANSGNQLERYYPVGHEKSKEKVDLDRAKFPPPFSRGKYPPV